MKLQAFPVLLTVAFAYPASAADLFDIYQIARENDSVVQATIAQHDAAIEALPLARSALRPTVVLNAEKSWTDTADDNEDFLEGDSYGASISQSLYAPDAWHAVKKAELNVEQAATTLQEVEQNLMFRVAQAYFNILTAEETLLAASSSREAISRQTEQAEKRFEVGLSAVTDVKEAQAQLDLAVAREIVAENQLAVAREALRVIINQDIPPLDPLSDNAILTNPRPTSVSEWISMAESNSPQLRIADLDLALAEKDIVIERAGRMPSVTLSGGYSNSSSQIATSPSREATQIRLQLDYSLYTGGRISALIRQANARATQARFNRETVRRAVEQETRDAYLSVIADVSQAKALRQALESTEVARQATQAGYDAGTRTAVELLVSLRDTFSARAEYAAARHQYVVRSLQLRLATGLLAEEHLQAVNRSLTARN